MHTREKGILGENAACTFLEKQGLHVIERNYLKKWGEIDVIASDGRTLHFCEVKSVTSFHMKQAAGSHRPEDNVHAFKARHIRRMIETYMAERGMSSETGFYFHVLCVYMNFEKRTARVKWIKNVIL